MSSSEQTAGVHSEVLSDESFRGPLASAAAVEALGGKGYWSPWRSR